jgi:hypothetical protein
MKKITVYLLALSLFSATEFSCKKKEKVEPKIEIDEKNLTQCPESASCQFLFTERADVDVWETIVRTGDYRLFWAGINYNGVDSKLYIKAPMKGNSFSMNKADILAGRIYYVQSCPACLLNPLKPIEGYVKGINLTPERPADQSKWLLEIKLYMVPIEGDHVTDTLSVKQYFQPNFMFD